MPMFLTPKTLNFSFMLLLNIISLFFLYFRNVFLTYKGSITLSTVIGFVCALHSLI